VADVPLTVQIRAIDHATRVFGTVGRAATGFTRMLTGAFRSTLRQVFSLRSALLGLGAGLGAREGIKAFSGLELGLANVAALTEDAQARIGEMGRDLERISRETGQAIDSLTKGLFDAVSAGVAAADATKVLAVAADLATGGVTTTASSMKGLVSIMNAYGLAATSARDVSDALFQAQRIGITTVEQLSESIGKSAPISRLAGVGYADLLAAVAALTQGGFSTDEAMTALRATLISAIKPSEDAKATLKRLGIEFNTTTIRTRGLIGLFDELAKRADLTEAEMASIAGSARAFSGVASLAADGASRFRAALETMQNRVGATDRAVGIISDTLSKRFARAIESVKGGVVAVVAEMRSNLTDGISILEEFGNSIRRNASRIAAVLKGIGESIRLAFNVIRIAFERGEIVQLVTASFGAIAEVMVKTMVDAVPLIIETAVLIGRQLGATIVQQFFISTKEQLALGLARGDLAAQFIDFIGLVPEEVTDKLRGIGQKIMRQQELIAREMGLITPVEEERLIRLRGELERFFEAMRTGALTGTRENEAALRSIQRIQEEISRLEAPRIPVVTVGVEQLKKELEDIRGGLGGERLTEGLFEADVVSIKRGAESLAENVVGNVKVALARAAKGLSPELAKAVTDLVGFVTSGFAASFKAAGLRDVTRAIGETFTEAASGIGELFETNLIGPLAAAGRSIGTAVGQAFGKAFGEEASGATTAQLTTEQLASLRDFEDQVRLLRVGGADQQVEGIRISLERELAEFKLLMEQKLITAAQFEEARGLLTEEAAAKIRAIEAELAEFAGIKVQEIVQTLSSNFTEFFLTLSRGTTTVKEAFRQLVTGILEQLARLALSRAFTSLFSGLFGLPPTAGAARGAIFEGGFHPIAKLQSGGLINRPTLGLVGEGGRSEAVVPLPDNRRIPVQFVGPVSPRERAAGATITTNITFRIFAMDGKDASRVIAEQAETIKAVVIRSLNTDAGFKRAVAARVS